MGLHAEKALWEQGCATWSDLLAGIDGYSCGSVDRQLFERAIKRSVKCLASGEHQFFRKGLGIREAWRAFPEFRSSCVYLDIETDGGQSSQSVTMIGLYDGANYRCLLKGEDLGNFPDIISHYSMIVTFAGVGFDLPTLQRCFFGLRFDQIHIDLCPTLRRVGHTGGLKRIEKAFGIERDERLAGLTGLDAVKLWRRYQRGDDSALETLIAYNREDVVNLEKLAEYAYLKLREERLGQPPSGMTA